MGCLGADGGRDGLDDIFAVGDSHDIELSLSFRLGNEIPPDNGGIDLFQGHIDQKLVDGWGIDADIRG